mmetsp:Transcript_7347/g.12360  ORF Transcript_7347/g.12360 Transcript_7347/m.12360 type:complete len:127 (+) Transcript_7347:65-445(+)
MVGAPFARLIANLLVMGTGVLGRAFMEAYKQAITNAGTSGSAAARGAARSAANEAEARLILNVKPAASKEEILKAYETLTAMNNTEKGGSAYLQAKVRFARDALIPNQPSEQSADASESTSNKKSS